MSDMKPSALNPTVTEPNIESKSEPFAAERDDQI
jgi:hypothetical protein